MCSKTQGKKEKADRQPALSEFKSCLLTYAAGLNKGAYVTSSMLHYGRYGHKKFMEGTALSNFVNSKFSGVVGI